MKLRVRCWQVLLLVLMWKNLFDRVTTRFYSPLSLCCRSPPIHPVVHFLPAFIFPGHETLVSPPVTVTPPRKVPAWEANLRLSCCEATALPCHPRLPPSSCFAASQQCSKRLESPSCPVWVMSAGWSPNLSRPSLCWKVTSNVVVAPVRCKWRNQHMRNAVVFILCFCEQPEELRSDSLLLFLQQVRLNKRLRSDDSEAARKHPRASWAGVTWRQEQTPNFKVI